MSNMCPFPIMVLIWKSLPLSQPLLHYNYLAWWHLKRSARLLWDEVKSSITQSVIHTMRNLKLKQNKIIFIYSEKAGVVIKFKTLICTREKRNQLVKKQLLPMLKNSPDTFSTHEVFFITHWLCLEKDKGNDKKYLCMGITKTFLKWVLQISKYRPHILCY